MPESFIIAPLLLGLSTGIYCFVYCIPFIAPVMISEKRGKQQDIKTLTHFILGRLIGYILFGAVFGYLGESINNDNLNIILNIALVLMSLILILHAFGLLRSTKSSFCANIKKHNKKFPLLMGFFMGINVCPPFLMSLAYIFTLNSALKGIIYFLMFFVGTTLYFIPLVLLGLLNKMKEFQLVGKISGLIVGCLFLFYGIYNIILLIN
ncbi:sulfite exporter TauE/SafE family protein [Patescibacteria group bacterium]|nr:sulfite exporter TauE/SafE family protein [Patescibacteria group bacterium]